MESAVIDEEDVESRKTEEIDGMLGKGIISVEGMLVFEAKGKTFS